MFLKCFTALVLSVSALLAQSSPDRIDEELEPIRRQHNLPGLTAMTVKRGQILAEGAAGVRHAGDPSPISVNDPINIGSCTKWMTATLAGRLVDRGIIEWRTRIRDVFSNWASFHPLYWDVSLEELLAHRGGVPEGSVWEPRYRPTLFTMNGSVTQLRRWVADTTLADSPQVPRGTELYSNQGYAIAATMLELRTGKSWETLMTEEVFAPLQMSSARIGSSYDSLRTPPPSPVGHDQTVPAGTPVPRAPLTGPDLVRYQAMAGPGGMVLCTLRDWARFLHRHAIDGEGYLAPATAKRLRTPWTGDTGYALGVGVLVRGFAEPDKALNHSGDILGQTALFWMAPAHDLILITYANTAARGSASAEGRDAAAAMMLARYRDSVPFGPYVDGQQPVLPLISTHPKSVIARIGEPARFEVTTTNSDVLAYQWRFNDVPLPGATGSRLTIETVGPEHVGYYSVDVRNAAGTTTTVAATLSMPDDEPRSRLANLSVLANLTDAQPLTVGFTVSGGAAPVLLRAVGPGLRPLGVDAPLPNPALALLSQGRRIAENDDWIHGAALDLATAAFGAFPLADGSPDAALLRTLQGASTVMAEPSRRTPSERTGRVLVELFDVGTSNSARLTNLSVLGRSGVGDAVLTAGFAIAGASPKRVLVRAVGPSLAQFGVLDAMDDPSLDIFNAERMRIGGNDDWNPALAEKFAEIGAFALAPGSRDAAVELSLPAGLFTIQVRPAATGVALLEVYELP